MKVLFIASAILLALPGSQAIAADMAAKASPPVVAAPPAWTGLYVGIEGGGAWGTTRSDVSDGLQGTGNFNLGGGLLGGTVGYNWQANNWLFGLEGDMSWADVKGSANEIPPFIVTTTNSVNEIWLATERARLGFIPADRWLTYITGGFAQAGVRATLSNSALAFSEPHTLARYGWTVGGGTEVALVANWSAKLEYLYVQLNDPTYFWLQPLPFVRLVPTSFPVFNQIVRAGLNYRF